MSKIIYTTTLTKPAPEIALANALAELLTIVPRKEVTAQAFSYQPPDPADEGRALSFKLTEAGYDLFKHGVVSPTKGWKDWPSHVPEADFSQYPL
jgi:hypothetical protein